MADNIGKNFLEDGFYFDEDDEDSQKDKYLTFNLGKEQYGISIRQIIGITELQKITEVPDMPDYVKGVINLRGKVIPVIDMRLRFGIEERDYDDRTCIIEIGIDDSSIGFIVDTVEEVLEISEQNIDPPPKFKDAKVKNLYISGMGKVGDHVKILLDVQKILHEDEIDNLKNIEEG